MVSDDSSDFLLQDVDFHETDALKKFVVHSHTGMLTERQQAYKAEPVRLASSSSVQ